MKQRSAMIILSYVAGLVALGSYWVMLVVSALFMVISHAHAGERWYGYTNVGISKAHRADDGTWWQKAYPNKNDAPSFSIGVGAGYKFNRRIHIEFGYVDLGRWDSTAEYLPDDALYQSGRCWRQEVDDDHRPSRCRTVSGRHTGYSRGLAASTLIRFRAGHYAVPYFRGGVYFLKQHLTADVKRKNGRDFVRLDFDRSSNGLLVGGGVQLGKHWSLDLTHYYHTGESGSLAWNGHTVLSGGFRF